MTKPQCPKLDQNICRGRRERRLVVGHWALVIKATERTPGLLPRPWDRIQFVAGDFGLWRGARRGAEPQRSVTRRATKPQAKSAATLRAEAVLPWGFVARSVEYPWIHSLPRASPQGKTALCK